MREKMIHVRRDPWTNALDVHYQDGNAWASLIQMEALEEGMVVPPAPIRIDMTAGQALMDQLWDCGIRPTDGTGSAGAMAATQSHLSDMRRIAFKALKLEDR